MKSGSGFLLVFFIQSSKVIPGLILILLIIQENSLLVFAKQAAFGGAMAYLTIGWKQLLSLPGPPGVLGRAHESGPDIGYSFNLCQSLNFSALGWLYLWEAGAGQMAPGTQYNGPSRSSRKLLRGRSLRGSVTQPQGQEEVKPPPPKSCSRIRATGAGFLSSLYFPLVSRAHPSPHVLRWRPVNSGYGGSLRSQGPWARPHCSFTHSERTGQESFPALTSSVHRMWQSGRPANGIQEPGLAC